MFPGIHGIATQSLCAAVLCLSAEGSGIRNRQRRQIQYAGWRALPGMVGAVSRKQTQMNTSAEQLIEDLMSKRPPRHKERAMRTLMIKGLLDKSQVQTWVKQPRSSKTEFERR